MKKFSFILCAAVALLSGICLMAQTPEQVVEKMTTELSRGEAEGLSMVLEINLPIIGKVRTQNHQRGSRLRTEMENSNGKTTTWIDGNTMWIYQPSKNEITIDKVDISKSASGSMDEMDRFSGITDGYDLSFEKQTEKAWYILCTKNKSNKTKDAPKTMNLEVAKGSYMPLSLRMKVNGLSIAIENVSVGVPEAAVVFKASDYPGAKITDKR